MMKAEKVKKILTVAGLLWVVVAAYSEGRRAGWFHGVADSLTARGVLLNEVF